MTALTGASLAEVGIDGAALKPTEVDIERAHDLDVGTLAVDFEGREHVPSPETLRGLADAFELRVTVPVRADGFDPRGDDNHRRRLPDAVSEVLVAGNGAYLDDHERKRAVAPRLSDAVASASDPWVGTEGIERLALAAGGTQFELLSRRTKSSVRGLREAGFDGEIAVYAPTVLTADDAAVLDAVGDYAARRRPVRERLPEGAPTDSEATGTAREILRAACREYALVGDPDTVADRVETLHEVGVDHVVGYPARGLDHFCQ
jgi:alkanesulfonate monooxygenase SsuD/methylene tetrahydromethanopterin reductase-like flavin-dependent oxidoreductase (luciferase family)